MDEYLHHVLGRVFVHGYKISHYLFGNAISVTSHTGVIAILHLLTEMATLRYVGRHTRH